MLSEGERYVNWEVQGKGGRGGWGGGMESMTCMTEHRRSYNNFRCPGGDR